MLYASKHKDVIIFKTSEAFRRYLRIVVVVILFGD